jgi:hypothetical protein
MGSQCLITAGGWRHHVYVPHTSPPLVPLLSLFSNIGRVALFAFALLFRDPHLASKRGVLTLPSQPWRGARTVIDVKRIKSSLVMII